MRDVRPSQYCGCIDNVHARTRTFISYLARIVAIITRTVIPLFRSLRLKISQTHLELATSSSSSSNTRITLIFARKQCPRTLAAAEERNPHISTRRPDTRRELPHSSNPPRNQPSRLGLFPPASVAFHGKRNKNSNTPNTVRTLFTLIEPFTVHTVIFTHPPFLARGRTC